MPRKKKLVLGAILAIILILVGVGVVMVINRQESNSNTAGRSNIARKEPNAALLGETFTDAKTGVTVRLPKGWELTPRDPENPSSLTKYQQTGGGAARANDELRAHQTSGSMDDIVRSYLEAGMDIHATPDVVNRDEYIVNKKVRFLSQEMPGPNGQNGQITQYIYYRKGTYYVLSFAILAADWEAQRPAIEASIASLEVK